MDSSILVTLLSSLVALLVGAAVGYLVRQQLAGQDLELAQSNADKLQAEAAAKRNELLLEAKDDALKISDGRGVGAPGTEG